MQNILLFLDKNFLDVEFQKVKAFVADFQYWRYFEDSSIIMSNEMLPEVKIVAPSSVNFMRQLHSDVVVAGRQSNQRQPNQTPRKQNLWEEKPLNI